MPSLNDYLPGDPLGDLLDDPSSVGLCDLFPTDPLVDPCDCLDASILDSQLADPYVACLDPNCPFPCVDDPLVADPIDSLSLDPIDDPNSLNCHDACGVYGICGVCDDDVQHFSKVLFL